MGEKKHHKTNIFDFLRDVLTASMDKGQLLMMFLGLFILAFIAKIPSSELIDFIKYLLNITNTEKIIGWILFVFVSLGSYFSHKNLKKNFHQEMERISEEKKHLQERLHKMELQSSKKKK